jgi:two-component system response regulator FixJ
MDILMANNDGDSIVYIIDDDPAVRDSLSLLLETNGLRARTYASPSDFLDSWPLPNCGCLVLDQRLPEMSGLELLSRISCTGKTPVLMITGHGDENLLAEAERQGVSKCLQKPFTSAEFMSYVRQALHVGASYSDPN